MKKTIMLALTAAMVAAIMVASPAMAQVSSTGPSISPNVGHSVGVGHSLGIGPSLGVGPNVGHSFGIGHNSASDAGSDAGNDTGDAGH